MQQVNEASQQVMGALGLDGQARKSHDQKLVRGKTTVAQQDKQAPSVPQLNREAFDYP